MRLAHKIEFVLLLIGFGCVGWYLFHVAERNLQQSYDSARLSPPPAEKLEKKRPSLPPGELIGRIEIPRIKISATVREGADDKVLKNAAGHVPYTALPGEVGNVGIAAHRDSFFRNLRHIREGDTIRFVTPSATYEYEVDSLKIVYPTNVEVLDPTNEPVLTLVTCFPFNYVGSAPKRFIVRARQIDTS